MRTRLRATLAVACVLLGACAARPVEFREPAAAIELRDTPFFSQTEFHCGPAALATVLAAQGVSVTPDALAPLMYTPARQGSLQAEVIAAARRHRKLPVRVEPKLDALIDALERGQPVLVLQNLGLRRRPTWHYAVLIGYDPARQELLLRSGTEPRQTMSAARFEASWLRAERWALVLADAAQIPEFTTPAAWLSAAAPFESLGQTAIAARAYEAAVTRWPDSALAWQAVANTRYAKGDARAAEQALHRALELAPDSAAARNNLAFLLAQRGCAKAARAQLDAITQIPPALAQEIEQTRASVEALGVEDSGDCAPQAASSFSR